MRSLEGGEVLASDTVTTGGRVITAEVRSGHRFDKRCYSDDALVLVVTGLSAAPISKDYCSAYGIGWVKLYVDAKGTPYLFHGVFVGRGTSVRTEHADVYRLKTRLDELGYVFIEGFATQYETYRYTYEVSTPPEGGLIVDTTLIPPENPEGCCEDLARHQRFRFDP
ncbi:hypothetical protein [Iodidimonas sp. SYSU 1G8]|uniref:hypothetical protein n=1 Tax=Iodidimonas sp. SYSU 1G8 TaxID=3133967 RepID=UPI0031FE62B3